MKKLLTQFSALVALTALAPVVLAHPGHDHGHWASSSIHLLFAGSIAAVVLAGIFVLRKSLKAKKAK